jgi:NAD(P)-dependent dehydrogenase (short-subunit alcohol dehydrogenase family)
MSPDFSTLGGQVAVVTGAGRGIGEVIARTLADAGAIVVLMGRSAAHLEAVEEKIRNGGGQAFSLSLDVTEAPAVKRRFEQIIEQFDTIDLLVNNAGNMGPLGKTWEIEPTQWWKTLETHLLGSFLCTKAALEVMTRHRRGRIINIVSHAGVYRWPEASAYSVAKAALIKFTENVAVEAKATQVKVFSLHPGIVIGAGLVSHLSEQPNIPGSDLANLLSWVDQQRLAGHSLPPSACAQRVLELATGYFDALNGRYLTAHDDLSVLLAQAPQIKRSDALTLRLKPIDFNDPADL